MLTDILLLYVKLILPARPVPVKPDGTLTKTFLAFTTYHVHLLIIWFEHDSFDSVCCRDLRPDYLNSYHVSHTIFIMIRSGSCSSLTVCNVCWLCLSKQLHRCSVQATRVPDRDVDFNDQSIYLMKNVSTDNQRWAHMYQKVSYKILAFQIYPN